MICGFKNTSCFLLWSIAPFVANGQIIYRNQPAKAWEARVPTIRKGNGVFLSPQNTVLIALSSEGTATAFNPDSGKQLWIYNPPTVANEFITSTSGITFTTNATMNFFVYSVIANQNNVNPKT